MSTLFQQWSLCGCTKGWQQHQSTLYVEILSVRSRTALKPLNGFPISRAQPSMNSPTGTANLPLGLLQGLLAFELELCTLLTCLLGSQMGPGANPEHSQVCTQHLSGCLADSFVAAQLDAQTRAGAGPQAAKEEWRTTAAGFPQHN